MVKICSTAGACPQLRYCLIETNYFSEKCFFSGLGEEQDDTCLPATEALVFMIVSVNGSWKLTIGYFLIATLQAEEKTALVKTALHQLSDVGVKTLSVTSDCPATNWSTYKILGAVFDPENLKPSFKHPSNDDQTVQVIFDSCHLIKLIRNCWSDFGIILDPENRPIKFVKLFKFLNMIWLFILCIFKDIKAFILSIIVACIANLRLISDFQ